MIYEEGIYRFKGRRRFVMQCEYLKNSVEIKEKLQFLFKSNCRKVAIVAFVGSNAVEYIPNKDNLTIYCWPHPGATSPNAIRQLQQKGVKVFFSDNMHKKIYWAHGRGTIIASANLTDNALSGEVLQESGVYISSNDFDIDKEISNLKNIRLAEHDEIEQLERKARTTERFIPTRKDKVILFKEFMEFSNKPQIKILNYVEDRTTISKEEIKENIKTEQKLKTVTVINNNDIESPAYFNVGDIVLQVKTFNDKDKIHGKNTHPLNWLFVDAITYSKKDKSYLVAQIKPNREVPFDINDSKFIMAFKKIFNSTEWNDKIDERCNVKESFWEKIASETNH